MPEVLERAEAKTSAPTTLPTVAIVGLGYVGLPVAVAFGRQRPTIGYDLSKKRIENLRHHVDATGEVSTADLLEARQFRATPLPPSSARPISSSSRSPRRSTPPPRLIWRPWNPRAKPS